MTLAWTRCSCCYNLFFFLIIRRPPRSTLFPYPTLFRPITAVTVAGHNIVLPAPITDTLEPHKKIVGNRPGFLDSILGDRKSTRLNSSHANISYAVFCLKKKKRSSTLSGNLHCLADAELT